jgi:SAM-dependent methyltransferase
MPKSINHYAQEWQQNAAADALWVILTDSKYYGRKWDETEFFATGDEEIGRIFDFMKKQGIELSSSGSFLDFGCGVGRNSKALRKRFEGGFGVDISEKMIELAHKYVQGVKFMVNKSDSLDQFANDSIDFIYSHIALQHIPNEYQRHYIDEFLRIMRPGGLAILQIPIEIINPQVINPPFAVQVKKEMKRLFPFLVSLKRWLIPPKHFHYDFKYEMHLLPDEVVRRICEKHGCVIEAAPATNSCEADHNGKVEFYDTNVYRHMLKESDLPNRYLSCMYYVRKR